MEGKPASLSFLGQQLQAISVFESSCPEHSVRLLLNTFLSESMNSSRYLKTIRTRKRTAVALSSQCNTLPICDATASVLMGQLQEIHKITAVVIAIHRPLLDP